METRGSAGDYVDLTLHRPEMALKIERNRRYGGIEVDADAWRLRGRGFDPRQSFGLLSG